MAQEHASTLHDAGRNTPLYRVLLGVLYFIALCALIAWEFRGRITILSSPCDMVQTAPNSRLYYEPYRYFLHLTNHDVPTDVSVVAIPANLDEIQGNICLARNYTADLLLAAAAQHPAEIVLDRFYTPDSCAHDPDSTHQLESVIRSLPFPVVIGESTTALPSPMHHSCLVRKPQLDFASPNVHHGITRLNADPEKLPLVWFILPADPSASNSKTVPRDTLSWAAVRFFDPTYAARPRLQQLANSSRNPYVNLRNQLPRQTSTQLLCSAATPDVLRRWSLTCDHNATHPNLLGKIVLIGSEGGGDHRMVLGTDMWGFDLQARYIDVLLSGNYLYELPFAAAFFIFALFIFVIEGIPTLLIAFRPHWRRRRLFCHAYTRRRYFWVSFWAIVFIVVTSLLSLVLRYLPPLAVLGDIVFVAITRLLSFAAESSEHPFVHAKKKGHHNVHS
jgi:hypothetical protein